MVAIAYQFISNEYDVHSDSDKVQSPLRRPTVYFALFCITDGLVLTMFWIPRPGHRTWMFPLKHIRPPCQQAARDPKAARAASQASSGSGGIDNLVRKAKES